MERDNRVVVALDGDVMHVTQDGVVDPEHRRAAFVLDLLTPGSMRPDRDLAAEGTYVPLAADVPLDAAAALLRGVGVQVQQ